MEEKNNPQKIMNSAVTDFKTVVKRKKLPVILIVLGTCEFAGNLLLAFYFGLFTKTFAGNPPDTLIITFLVISLLSLCQIILGILLLFFKHKLFYKASNGLLIGTLFLISVLFPMAILFNYRYNLEYPQSERLKVKSESNPTMSKIQDASWNTYSNKKYNFSINYPGDLEVKEYVNNPKYDNDFVKFLKSNSDFSCINIDLTIKPIETTTNFKDWIKENSYYFQNPKDPKISLIKGEIMQYTNSLEKSITGYWFEGGAESEGKFIFILHNSNVYEFSAFGCGAGDSYKGYPETVQILEKMISTLKFTITLDPTENWKTYVNKEYGFSFKYPSDTFNIVAGCKMNTQGFYDLEEGSVPITLVEKGNTIIISPSYYYFASEYKNFGATKEPTKCEKIDLSKDVTEELRGHTGNNVVKVGKVANDQDLETFIKNNLGNRCALGSKEPVTKKSVNPDISEGEKVYRISTKQVSDLEVGMYCQEPIYYWADKQLVIYFRQGQACQLMGPRPENACYSLEIFKSLRPL